MKREYFLACALAIGLLVAGCASPPPKEKPKPVEVPKPVIDISADLARIQKYKRESHDQVTKHALQASSLHESSVDSLASYLAPKEYSDLDRAWSIYVWMADRIAYDVPAYLSGHFRNQSVKPEDVLRKRMSVCDGFAGLFSSLAKQAGLEVVIVEGFAKAYGVKPGEIFKMTNHAWVMLKVGHVWQVVDPTWGAGFVHEDTYYKQIDQDYFLAPVDDLKFTHWPHDEKWRQTIGLRLTKSQFETQPSVDPGLFRAGVSGAEISWVIAEPAYDGLVAVYEQNHKGLRVISIPLQRKLQSSKMYRFALESTAFEEISFMNGSAIHSMTRNGSLFETQYQPAPGSLLITGRSTTGGRPSGLFRYEVE
jgi:transglutaminase-like putative cysteine protease